MGNRAQGQPAPGPARHGMWPQPKSAEGGTAPASPSPAQSDVLWHLRKHDWKKMLSKAQPVFNAFNVMQAEV